jgi:translation elongation factor aEF-1 beta
MTKNTGGIMGVKIKIMPTSPSINLNKIEEEVKDLVEKNKGYNREYIIEPVAFGLKALIAFFEWPEESPLEEFEEELGKIKDVNSVQVIDMRKIA